MSKCICVNIDKEEYLDFGELPASSYRDTPACNTVEYLLGTEWSGDKVVFAFENMEPGGLCPEPDETLFSYAMLNFDERCILNRAPKYRYLVNIAKMIYYDKLKIPMGADKSYFDPISILLSAVKENAIIGVKFSDDESEEVGMWCGDTITAVNNMAMYPGIRCYAPSFRCDALNSSGNLSGLKFVITGTFPNHDRYEVEEMIEKAGGMMQKSITKKTDYLVVADKPGKTKLDKARAYGTELLSVDEFMDML